MNEIQSKTHADYNVVEEDPVSQLSLIDKHVNIQLIKNSSFVGFVHAIDPVTKSVILSVPKEEIYQTILIPGHAILHIMETEPLPNIKVPSRKTISSTSQADKLARKRKLIAWFKFNLLPVTEESEKILFGNVCILPPYNVTDICTDNPIVALQIKKIMEKMPLDFDPKL